MLENESFRRFLKEKSLNIKVGRYGEIISWEESVESGKHSFTGFLEFAYSKKTSGEYIYLDRSTAFDILDRINWMDGKIKSLRKRLRILTLLLLLALMFAAWGWLT
ncbi:MAG: hypothetical protein QXN75_01775 [Thermoproteota archaeon]|nr:hypothetical protein [Candidatus Brockarchaeota archaeon]